MKNTYAISSALNLEQFNTIVRNNKNITFTDSVWEKVNKSYDFLKVFANEKLIYGINTGFGPMAQYKIEQEDQITLQINLIKSHASGLGKALNNLECKAAFLARLLIFMQGKSGVHPSLPELMIQLWNAEAVPVIYEHGGVGASGDLVQLAHIALGLLGEGKFYVNGEIKEAKEVFKQHNLKPLQIYIREGLALMNGTSCMTGIAALNVYNAKKLIDWAITTGVWINELMDTYDDHFSLALNQVKKHKGQMEVAKEMSEIAVSSKWLKSRKKELYDREVKEKVITEKVQEYYSLRCIPQIIGPVIDTLSYTEKIVEQELNSVSDNPIIDADAAMIYHGGNFHGDYISLEMDKLKIAITKVSMLWDRQLNYLLNPNLNKKFPPFLNTGVLGLEFGLQGMQYPAVSNVAENQMLSNPMYIHSIPNNNDNQDIVSMGSNAALITKRVIQNTFESLSIYLLALCKASQIKGNTEKFSNKIQEAITFIQAYLPDEKHGFAPFEKMQKLVGKLQ